MPSPYIETISLYSEDRANADSRAFQSRQNTEHEDFHRLVEIQTNGSARLRHGKNIAARRWQGREVLSMEVMGNGSRV
jgi:hypothetical protein